MKKPDKWHEVYPQGNKEGNEEHKFWTALARDPTYDWRSTAMIVKVSGLSRQRVEELIQKYAQRNPPLIYQSPTNTDQWGYWERVPDMVEQSQKRSLTGKDHKDRLDIHLSKDKDK